MPPPFLCGRGKDFTANITVAFLLESNVDSNLLQVFQKQTRSTNRYAVLNQMMSFCTLIMVLAQSIHTLSQSAQSLQFKTSYVNHTSFTEHT